jgi:hypothetical protein
MKCFLKNNNDTSLKITDNVIEKPLLTFYDDFVSKSYNNIIFDKIIFEDFILTKKECSSIIFNANCYGLLPLDSYDKKDRDANRLCVIDNNLAQLLWNRLSTKIKEHKLIPYGLHNVNNADLWYPSYINSCFRISSYQAPSIGFKPHYDSQYIPNMHERSRLSLVIYLNDEYENGNTILFDIKNKKHVSGLTVDEEIKLHGGIDNYTKYNINPITGKFVVFEQNILHCGDFVTNGKKYILRTDIVYKLKPEYYKQNYISNISYQNCNMYFREAQNQEIEGNNSKASELYEHALSIRLNYNKENHNNLSWIFIFNFLSIEDQLKYSVLSWSHNMLKLNYISNFGRSLLNKQHLIHSENINKTQKKYFSINVQMYPIFLKLKNEKPIKQHLSMII